MKRFRQKKWLSLLIGTLFSLCSVFLIPTAHAQEVQDISDISIVSIPVNPSPGQTVSLTAQSFSVDLNQVTLTWTYGGKTIEKGFGKTRVSVIAPAAGNTAIATVTATSVGLDSLSTSILLNPASADILWEAADAYTPPFYKGKASLPIGGMLRVTAIPSASAPKQLTYTWTRNGSAMQAASGLNQSSVLLQNTIFNKQESISMTAYGGSFQGDGSVVIPVSIPSVVAYQKKEGFIDYAHGSTNVLSISGNGTVLRFEPYNFSVLASVPESLSFAKLIDKEPVPDGSLLNELRISTPQDKSPHQIDVDVTTKTYSLQHARRLFNLIFN